MGLWVRGLRVEGLRVQGFRVTFDTETLCNSLVTVKRAQPLPQPLLGAPLPFAGLLSRNLS